MADKFRKFKLNGSNQENRQAPRSNVARGMIEAGTGKSQKFRDRRDRRANEREREWERDWEES